MTTKKTTPAMRTMRLFEITYRSDENPEPKKVRVVTSCVGWAAGEIFKRKYKGRNKQVLSLDDQGTVIVSDRRQDLKELMHERAELVGGIVDAIEKDISDIEADELVLAKHRKNMERFVNVKERLIEMEKTAPRGPFV